MKIAVAGTGYGGLSMATLLSQHNTVNAVDLIQKNVARQFGASAKFTGSGGAIIGTYRADTFDDMRRELKKYGVEVIKPEIVKNT